MSRYNALAKFERTSYIVSWFVYREPKNVATVRMH